VRIVKNVEELEEAVKDMLGKVLKTFQCPDGKPVNRVWIEKATAIERELYLSITLDRARSRPVIMASAAGGMEIEEIVKENPEAIVIEEIDPALGLMPYQARKLAYSLGLPVKDSEGSLVALDAKLEIDDNALFRHRDIEEMEDESQLSPLEVEAKKYGLNYIKLSGN